jgi:uncharacterized protein
MHVVISGASGLIGSALAAALHAGGHRVHRLVRRAPHDDEVRWDPAAGALDAAVFDGKDAVVHLAGAGLGEKRWTESYKQQILESRTAGTTLVAEMLARMARPPAVLVSASAIGFYGDGGDAELDESSPAGTGFLAEVCQAWEGATVPAEQAGVRVVHIRSGLVLSTRGGGLKRMLPLFKLGLGGRFGHGDQWWSWIALDDEVRAILHLLDDVDVQGPVNLTAPEPVTNREFTEMLAMVLGRRARLPVPRAGPALVLGGELADNLLYTGQRVLPKVLQASGFEFRQPALEGALRDVLGAAGKLGD